MYGINNSAFALSGLIHILNYENRALPYSKANALSGLNFIAEYDYGVNTSSYKQQLSSKALFSIGFLIS